MEVTVVVSRQITLTIPLVSSQSIENICLYFMFPVVYRDIIVEYKLIFSHFQTVKLLYVSLFGLLHHDLLHNYAIFYFIYNLL